MVQETVPAFVERGLAASASSPLEPPAPANPQAISRLALAALWLGIGTSLSVALVALDGWLMSQGALETHDLPELATYVLPLPTLSPWCWPSWPIGGLRRVAGRWAVGEWSEAASGFQA